MDTITVDRVRAGTKPAQHEAPPPFADGVFIPETFQESLAKKRSQTELAHARAETNWWRLATLLMGSVAIIMGIGWNKADTRFANSVRVAWVKVQPNGASQVEYFDDGQSPARFFQAQINAAFMNYLEHRYRVQSFRPKDGSGEPPGPGRNGERDFHGEKRSNKTHASTTDPDAKLYRKAQGQPSRIAFMGHVLMENRNGLVVGATLTPASGTAEREAALALVDGLGAKRRITLGADKAYDAREFVAELRKRKVTPHIARHDYVDKNGVRRRSALDGRTTRHPGYDISLRVRKRIEEVFGWVKTTGSLRKTRHRGTERVNWMFTLTAAAYNLVRLPKLMAAA